MNLELGILETRVARRILGLFLVCAVVPVSALSVLSYVTVRNQLIGESQDRLSDMARNAGLALAERLQFLESTARLALVPVASDLVDGSVSPSSPSVSSVVDGFDAALVAMEGRALVPMFGELAPPLDLNEGELAHLSRGLSLVRVRQTEGGNTEILMALGLAASDASTTNTLWARAGLDFLWSTASGYSTLPSTAGLCVLGQAMSAPLYCTLPDAESFLEALEDTRTPGGDDSEATYELLEWSDRDGEEYSAASWDLFLRPQFFLSGVTVSVSESRASTLSPMAAFRQGFWGVMAVGLVAVALLSNIQIRKSLNPLNELREGTRRLANGVFGKRVSVSSRDEFEELADSFNSMATQLEAQFKALRTIGEIDRAILSNLDADQIVETVLLRVDDLVDCDMTAVCRLNWLGAKDGALRTVTASSETAGDALRVRLSAEDLEMLLAGDEPSLVEGELATQYFGDGPANSQLESALLASLILPGGLAGYLAVGRTRSGSFTETDASRLRQVAKQLSTALSNAWLLEELERMNWGALTALARTIDAKSPWTSGHSERVSILSVTLGRAIGLSDASIRALQQGGLLHDIGKIAVPGRILEDEGSLTDEEQRIYETHPGEGVLILEPITALEVVLPIVLHHHEAWDGSGFPMGLKGEAIPLEARIVAVANEFDALTSNRASRIGMGLEGALGTLRKRAGRSLDPTVVEAFVSLVEAGDLPIQVSDATPVA